MGQHLLPEGAAPSTPSTGYVSVYAKADGLLYSKDDAGVETPLGGSASSSSSTQWTTITADPSPAMAGSSYQCNTTSAAFTVTLPAAPAANDLVRIADYAGTFATNNLTLGRNALNIMGLAEDMVISTNNASITLTYVDATQGWRIV